MEFNSAFKELMSLCFLRVSTVTYLPFVFRVSNGIPTPSLFGRKEKWIDIRWASCKEILCIFFDMDSLVKDRSIFLDHSVSSVGDQLFTRDKYDLFTNDRDWLLTDLFFTSESLSPIASDRSQFFTSNGY